MFWFVFTEQEAQETRVVMDEKDTSDVHELQQQLQQANETIAQLLQQQQQLTLQSPSALFVITI